MSDGRLVRKLRRHSSVVNDVAFSDDGQWVATVGPHRVALWSTETGPPVVVLQSGNKAILLAGTFLPGSRVIRTAGRDGVVRQYRCDVCGNVAELRALAQRRLTPLAR